MNTVIEPGPQRRVGLIFGILFVIIVLIAIAPVLSVMTAGLIANLNGCALDEGSVHPCFIFGADFGGTLYFMGVMGWFGLVTLPLGGLALLVWFVALIVTLVLRRRTVRRGEV